MLGWISSERSLSRDDSTEKVQEIVGSPIILALNTNHANSGKVLICIVYTLSANNEQRKRAFQSKSASVNDRSDITLFHSFAASGHWFPDFQPVAVFPVGTIPFNGRLASSTIKKSLDLGNW
jgi:hypothetical protein